MQITGLMTERKRQPRAKSDLPFTDLSDSVTFVPRLLSSAPFLTSAIGDAWYPNLICTSNVQQTCESLSEIEAQEIAPTQHRSVAPHRLFIITIIAFVVPLLA